MLRWLLVSARPNQWYKNFLLFAGIVFSGNILEGSMWGPVILAFVYFCLLSAAEYLINDVLDRERDRSHPVKRNRPIASGQLKVEHAVLFALSLAALALIGAYLTINVGFFVISASYLLLVIFYSLVLKHIAIVDVLVISAGFVIRAAAGAIAIDVVPSSWLIICVFGLALFLALEKRRQELVILADETADHRSSFSDYTPAMVELLITIVGGALIVSYLMYTFYSEYDHMLITAPFVVYGVFRYIYLTHQKGVRAEPDVVLRDKAMLINIALWALTAIAIVLYNIRS